MSKIQEIQQKIATGYMVMDEQQSVVEIPFYLQTFEWVDFANKYMSAASVINDFTAQLWLPRLQLTGHAVECALKACISAAGTKPPHGHDLVKIYEDVEKLGFGLDELAQAWIIHLAHYYTKDVSTSTQYKARYPTKNMERVGGAVPDHAVYVSLTQLLCEQAKCRNQQLT